MSAKPFIVDGHLDLSMNAMEWNRDLRMEISDIRSLESDMNDKPDRGNSTLCFPEMHKGNVGLCLATLIARYAKPDHPLGGWRSPEQAWSMTQGQLSWYREMEGQGILFQIKNRSELRKHIQIWDEQQNDGAIGYILTLEGADSILSMHHLEKMYSEGLRAVGPAHYGPGTYAFGTNSEGGIGHKGKILLKTMDELDMVLDLTHLCDTSFWEALDTFKGHVWASHSNCRSIVNHNRQFSDDQIKILIDRNAIIGMPFDAWMMVANWQKGISHPSNTEVTLEDMIDHIDHICQIAGNAHHVGLGTDLDGGFGKEQCPSDIDTIADLQKIPQILKNRGYKAEEVSSILSSNWLRKFNEVLPE